MTKSHRKLIDQHIKLSVKLSKVNMKLREIYEKNPKKCVHCNKALEWRQHGPIDHETGESVSTCICRL